MEARGSLLWIHDRDTLACVFTFHSYQLSIVRSGEMNPGPNDVMDAVWMVLIMIMIGAMIGLAFHHWPLPVNESVFVTGKKEVK